MDDQLLNDNMLEINFHSDLARCKVSQGASCDEQVKIISDCIHEITGMDDKLLCMENHIRYIRSTLQEAVETMYPNVRIEDARRQVDNLLRIIEELRK